MIRITKLDHVVIRSKNPENLVEFYSKVLGCPIERQLSGDVELFQLRAGDALIDIIGDHERRNGSADDREGRNMDHFCVLLDSFNENAIREHLAKHGVTGSKLETRYGAAGNGPSIYIQDPDGNTIELKGPSA